MKNRNQSRTALFKNADFVEKINALNVQYQIESILRMSDIIADMVDARQIGIVGGIYDLNTGKVNFLENTLRI